MTDSPNLDSPYVCPTCGHRRSGDRPNGQLTDARCLVLQELSTTTDKKMRFELILRLSDLQIMANWDKSEKRQVSIKKLELRKKRTTVEKTVRKITKEAKKQDKIRKKPEFNPAWSLDKKQTDKIVPPPPIVRDIEAVQKQNIENLLNFVKPKDEPKDNS
jgi:hypothetical protein